MSISELCEKIEKKLQSRNPRLFKIDILLPEEELGKYTDFELLISSVEKNLLIPMCAVCTAVRPNGKWVGPSDYTNILRQSNYRPLSFSYCPECLKNEMKKLKQKTQLR